MLKKKTFNNKIVIITGAAGGVGKCLAHELAKDGAHLILTDLNENSLKKFKKELLKEYAIPIDIHPLDVSQENQVKQFADQILKKYSKIDLLINNAGIGYSGELVETSIDQIKKLFDINFWGPLYHIYAFLPSMIKNKSGHIVNVSSGQAFFRLPTWGAYAVTKLALGAFSEVLKHEVKKFNINVTTCYPFMINTGFYDKIAGDGFWSELSMKLVPYYSMSPQKVARLMIKAIQKNKSVEMISPLNNIAKLSHFPPKAWDLIAASTIKILGKDPKEMDI